MNPEIIALHAAYVKLTGLELRLDHGRECVWGRWLQAGFTLDDLETVIKYIQRGISKGERNAGALRFRNLITMIDYFEEELAMARKTFRTRKPSREEAVSHLIAAGHTVTILEEKQPEQDFEAAKEIAKKEMEKFREQMKGGV